MASVNASVTGIAIETTTAALIPITMAMRIVTEKVAMSKCSISSKDFSSAVDP